MNRNMQLNSAMFEKYQIKRYFQKSDHKVFHIKPVVERDFSDRFKLTYCIFHLSVVLIFQFSF